VSINLSELAWQMLESVPQKEITTRSSDVRVDVGFVLHSLDSTGHRHLLIPLAEDAQDVEDTKSRGVTVVTRTLLQGPHGDEQTFIDVKCEEVALRDLFSKVCDEILELCDQSPSAPQSAVTVVLERWRELLGPASQKLLTELQLKGLLAELHVLEGIAEISSQYAMRLWTGADKARHDFTGVNAACEVKASSLTDEVKVHINGLNQLTPPPGSTLYLAVERFERVPVGGDSVPASIDRLEHRGLDRHKILTAISRVGAYPADFDVYTRIQFISLERRLYKVSNDFPRLSNELLNNTVSADRISNVEYVLNLGAQPPVPLGDRAVDQLPYWLLDGFDQVR